ncbi:MAG: MFS transporter, partial [Bacteroidales bacterium]|nr:MFS transporter [Bacteroidales bacterium]
MVERKNSWLPVVALTIAAFVFNSSEAMPIGLMTDIAEGLGVSDSAVGMLVSGYAWVVAFMSLPLMVAFSKMEYRRLMIGIVTLFMLSHVLSAVSTGYWMLMGSRVGVACAHSIFWAIAPPVAVKVAPEGKGPLAMSMIITGTSIAQIVGMPTGRA